MQVTDWLLGNTHYGKNPNVLQTKVLKTELRLKLQPEESWLELWPKT